MPRVAAIDVDDDPTRWRQCGFTVSDDGTCHTGLVRLRISPPGSGSGSGDVAPAGVTGWTLAELDAPESSLIDGLPTQVADDPPPDPGHHANGTVSIDHIVVVTPDVERTVAAYESVGVPLKRRRRGESMGRPVHQAFFRLGEVVLEIAGPPEPEPGAESVPARIWGLAFTVTDLETTAACLGERLGPPRDAVQPGRRIASVRRHTGLAVPVAFLTPEPR